MQRESEQAGDLKSMLIALGFPKPPANITPQQLFNKVDQKVGRSPETFVVIHAIYI